MKKVFRANMYFLIILLIEIFAPTLLSKVYVYFNLEDIRIILLLNHMILFLIPAIIYLILTRSSFKETFRFNKLHLKDMFLVILLAFAVQPVMTFFSLISAFFFNNEIGSFVTDIISTPYLLLLGLVALLPSITEEITIRGVVLSGYENKNRYIASMITGLFFGMLHLDPQQFLYASVLGFILALVVRITNSIFASMIIHFIVNGTSVTMAKVVSYINELIPISNETAELTLKNISLSEKLSLMMIYGIIALIFGVAVFFIIRALDNINEKRRGGDSAYRNKIYDLKEEKIAIIPLILSVVIYLTFMVRTMM